jgi:hypothetical protein
MARPEGLFTQYFMRLQPPLSLKERSDHTPAQSGGNTTIASVFWLPALPERCDKLHMHAARHLLKQPGAATEAAGGLPTGTLFNHSGFDITWPDLWLAYAASQPPSDGILGMMELRGHWERLSDARRRDLSRHVRPGGPTACEGSDLQELIAAWNARPTEGRHAILAAARAFWT